MNRPLPLAKKEGLLIEELEGEVVIYDLARKKAHCLNAAAAIVFRACDGKTSSEQVVDSLRKTLGPASDEHVVWTALQQLEDAHLLEAPLAVPFEQRAVSRRELAKVVGMGLSLLPLVVSLAAPNALAAASHCFRPGQPCVKHFDCCSGFCDNNSRCR